jgi:ribosome-associated heat shock protein Hsp15
LSGRNASPPPVSRRLDQWLWFARFVKTRSLASRLCAEGGVSVNGIEIRKANRTVRIGDAVAVPQGAFRRTVRVLALGIRRGPAIEARALYEEAAAPVLLSELVPAWTPLLADDDPRSDPQMSGGQNPATTKNPGFDLVNHCTARNG